jgi:hypothetical protein
LLDERPLIDVGVTEELLRRDIPGQLEGTVAFERRYRAG